MSVDLSETKIVSETKICAPKIMVGIMCIFDALAINFILAAGKVLRRGKERGLAGKHLYSMLPAMSQLTNYFLLM